MRLSVAAQARLAAPVRVQALPSVAAAVSLAAITLLAIALRLYRIDAQSLWYDEGISAHQLTRSFAEIIPAAARDTHPPLYYWTLKAWGETIGGSELGLRSLSAFWGVLTVVLTWLMARRLFGLRVATVAGILLAAAPLDVYYSQEVRMYTQVTALGMLASLAYMYRVHWLYALAGIATLYTQYLGAAFLIALNVHALLWWRTRTRTEWLHWIGANVALALAFLPWLPTFVDQQTHALNTSPRTPLGLALETLNAYGGGLAHADLFVLTGGALVLLALAGAARPRFGTTLVLAAWLLPLALVLFLGLRSGLFESRYLVLSLPGLFVLAALGVVWLTRYRLIAVAATAVLLVPAAQALMRQYFDPALARDDYRGVVQTIQSEAQPTDAILLSAPNQVEVFSYYYHGPLPVIGLPAQRPIDPPDTVRRLEALKTSYSRVWLVDWAMNEADPPGVIATWLAQNGFQASHAWYGSVQLALIGFGSASAPIQQLHIAMSNGIGFDGYRLSAASFKPGDTLQLTLFWSAPNGATADHWKVFTHLLDQDMHVLAQRDAEPGDALRPTTSWQPGEHIADNYGIALPLDLPPGDYTLEIGMYNGETRAVFDGHGDHLVLGAIHVSH